MADLFAFEWAVDQAGYDLELLPPDPEGGSQFLRRDARWVIRRRGGPLRYYRPTEGLHRRFTNLAPTDKAAVTREAALDFVNEFGVLGEWFGAPDAAEQDYEALSRAQFDVWDVMQTLDKGKATPPHHRSPEATRAQAEAASARAAHMLNGRVQPRMNAMIDTTNPRRLSLQIVPRSLLSFIWFQAIDEITGRAAWRRCKECPTWYPVGKGLGTQRKEFCSNRCRIAWNRQKNQGSAEA